MSVLDRFMSTPTKTQASALVFNRDLVPLREEQLKRLGRVSTREQIRTTKQYFLPALGDLRVTETRVEHIEAFARWLASLKLSSNRILSVKSAARSTFEVGVRKGIIDRNPVDAADPEVWPARSTDRDTAAEVLSIREATRLGWEPEPMAGRLYAGAMFCGGPRMSELFAINFGDIRRVDDELRAMIVSKQLADDGSFRPTKTGSVKVVPLLPWHWKHIVEPARRELERRERRAVRPEDPVFFYYFDGELRRWNPRTALKRLHKDLGRLFIKQGLEKPMRFHALRHFFITQSIAAGARREDVALITHQRKGRDAIDAYIHHDMEGWAQKVDVMRRLEPDWIALEQLTEGGSL